VLAVRVQHDPPELIAWIQAASAEDYPAGRSVSLLHKKWLHTRGLVNARIWTASTSITGNLIADRSLEIQGENDCASRPM